MPDWIDRWAAELRWECEHRNVRPEDLRRLQTAILAAAREKGVI